MMRYLRGKGFLDILHDIIARMVPGRAGTVIGAAIVPTIGLTYTYVVNYQTIARWF
jgi:hypothetical protein